jgi:hypothetical protein
MTIRGCLGNVYSLHRGSSLKRIIFSFITSCSISLLYVIKIQKCLKNKKNEGKRKENPIQVSRIGSSVKNSIVAKRLKISKSTCNKKITDSQKQTTLWYTNNNNHSSLLSLWNLKIMKDTLRLLSFHLRCDNRLPIWEQ